jgi:hypothetical protein
VWRTEEDWTLGEAVRAAAAGGGAGYVRRTLLGSTGGQSDP